MSKFEELCKTFDEAHREVTNYLDSCGQFTGNLVTGLEVYLNCPPGKIQFKDKAGNRNSLRESMYLEQGAWHLDIAIKLCRENGVKYVAASDSGLYYPSQTVFISLLIKRATTASFIVEVAHYSNKQFSINVNQQVEFASFYDFVCEIVKAHYKNMLRYIVEHGEVPQEVGLGSISLLQKYQAVS